MPDVGDDSCPSGPRRRQGGGRQSQVPQSGTIKAEPIPPRCETGPGEDIGRQHAPGTDEAKEEARGDVGPHELDRQERIDKTRPSTPQPQEDADIQHQEDKAKDLGADEEPKAPRQARQEVDHEELDVGQSRELDPFAPHSVEGEWILCGQQSGGNVQRPRLQVPPGVARYHFESARQKQMELKQDNEED